MEKLHHQVQGEIDADLQSSLADPVFVSDVWQVSLLSDETLNDSDKTFVVPADTEYQILWIWVEFSATATVGDRQIVIEVQDTGADVIAQWARAGVVQAANLVRFYLFAPAVADLTGFRDLDFLSTPIPPTSFLQAGDILRIYDNNAVDAAADDMIIQMQIGSRAV